MSDPHWPRLDHRDAGPGLLRAAFWITVAVVVVGGVVALRACR